MGTGAVRRQRRLPSFADGIVYQVFGSTRLQAQLSLELYIIGQTPHDVRGDVILQPL